MRRFVVLGAALVWGTAALGDSLPERDSAVVAAEALLQRANREYVDLYKAYTGLVARAKELEAKVAKPAEEPAHE